MFTRNSIGLLILILFFLKCVGQDKIRIEKPTLNYLDQKLYITYDLDNRKYEYNITVEIINSSGNKINARSLSGEIGSNIKAGNNKSIVWNMTQDDIYIDDDISVKVIANLTPKAHNKGKLILQSTVCPGWGQTKYSNGKPYWVIGVAGVACLAGSYWYNQKAVNSYDSYKVAVTTLDNGQYYDKAIQYDNTSKILGYSAIGIWAVNIIWMALTPNESKSLYSYKRTKVGLNSRLYGDNTVSVSLVINLK